MMPHYCLLMWERFFLVHLGTDGAVPVVVFPNNGVSVAGVAVGGSIVAVEPSN